MSLHDLLNCTTTKNCSNNSDISGEDESDCDTAGFSVESDTFPIVIAVLIIAVNSWVIILVSLKRNLRTVPNYILTSLAVSDLCTGLFSIPLFLSCNMVQERGICVAAMVVMRFISVSTVLHIVVMTADRYICIVHALRYVSLVTKRRALRVVAAIWLFSLFMALIQLSWTNLDEAVDQERSPEAKRSYIIFDIFCLVVFIGVPVLFMAFAYGRILYEVHRQSHNIRENNSPGWQETRGTTRQEWKVASIFLTMLVVFVLCWLPFFLLRLQQITGAVFVNLHVIVEIVLFWLRFCSSLINPCLYILGKPDFRKAACLGKKGREREKNFEMTLSSQWKTMA